MNSNDKNTDQIQKGVNEMTNAEITKTVLQIQDKTQASTERSKKLIQETIEVVF